MKYAARGIIIEDGKMLVMERRRVDKNGNPLHYLSIPGGQIEDGELPEEALVREFREEMLIEVEVERLVSHVYMTADKWYQSQEHLIFACRRTSGEPVFNLDSPEAKVDNPDNYKIAWRDVDKLRDAPALHPLYLPVLDALLPYLHNGTLPEAPIDIDVANLL